MFMSLLILKYCIPVRVLHPLDNDPVKLLLLTSNPVTYSNHERLSDSVNERLFPLNNI